MSAFLKTYFIPAFIYRIVIIVLSFLPGCSGSVRGPAVYPSKTETDILHEKINYLISDPEFLMHDGSGLSRVNLISPATVGKLLRFMAKSPYAPYFIDSLPVAGIDGTLRSRMKDTPAEGKIRAKTGYVGHVRNLSGYVHSANGEKFLFSILVNNYLIPTPAINLLQDRICILLANFSRLPAP